MRGNIDLRTSYQTHCQAVCNFIYNTAFVSKRLIIILGINEENNLIFQLSYGILWLQLRFEYKEFVSNMTDNEYTFKILTTTVRMAEVQFYQTVFIGIK
jgi:hypothetical protein